MLKNQLLDKVEKIILKGNAVHPTLEPLMKKGKAAKGGLQTTEKIPENDKYLGVWR